MFVLRVKHVDANLLNHQYYVSLWYTGSDKPPGTEKKLTAQVGVYASSQTLNYNSKIMNVGKHV